VKSFVSAVAKKASTAAAATVTEESSVVAATQELPLGYIVGAFALGAVMSHVLLPLLK
jgi:hypothetical protein